MKQSKKQSLIETATDMIVGYAINVTVVIAILGHSATVATSIGILMFVLSFARKYAVRRIFNHTNTKGSQ